MNGLKLELVYQELPYMEMDYKGHVSPEPQTTLEASNLSLEEKELGHSTKLSF